MAGQPPTGFPPLPVVNRQDEVVGEAMLEEIYRRGLIFRVVYVLVEDQAGRLLLQKRGSEMATYPNCWDISTAGHVDLGEDYETAAVRELREELGLSDCKLEEIDYEYGELTAADYQLKRFVKVYRTTVPESTPLKTDPWEIAETRWLTIPEAKQLATDHPDEIAVGLSDCLQKYYPEQT